MSSPEADALDRADMRRLAAGHDAALNDLMERHATALFHFLGRMLGNEDDANDLAQETFVRVFEHRARFRPEAKFSAWLFTIAANLARNQLRQRRRRPHVSLDAESETTAQTLGDTLASDQPAPGDGLLAGERADAVRAALGKLPEEMRETILLVEFEDKSVAETAAILAVPPKTVESRLHRARKSLRERLAKWL